MKRFNWFVCICCGLFAVLLFPSVGRAGKYSEDFTSMLVGASTNFPGNAKLFSTSLGDAAGVTDLALRELQLTHNGIGNTRTAFLLPDLDPGTSVYAFSAKWNADVFGGFPEAADGFSFTFGQVGGLNLINSAYAQESGYGTGLCFSVQTYPGNNPGFYIRANGATIASHPYNPSTQWGSNNVARHFFEVDWHYLNGLTVRVNHQTIFTNVIPYGFIPRVGDQFVWAARTGGLSQEVRLDNIVVMTGGNLVQTPATSPYFANLYPIEAHFAFDNLDYSQWWCYSSPTGYIGATVGLSRVLAYAVTSSSISGSGADWQFNPKDWQLEGSYDDGESWVKCGTGSGYFMNRAETRAWTAGSLTNANDIRTWQYTLPRLGAYRLNIATNHGASSVAVGELRLYSFNPVDGNRWLKTSLHNQNWNTVACSTDRTVIVTANNGASASDPLGGIFVSTNSGATWQQGSPPHSWNWLSIACSADGKKILAGPSFGPIYFSTNSGATWAAASSPSATWISITASADGTKMAAIGGSAIYVSTDSGATWVQSSAPSGDWRSIVSSTDGTKLAAANAASSGGGIFTSSNSGATWAQTSALSLWKSLACSADGSQIAGAGWGVLAFFGVSVSTNSGTNWVKTSAPERYWNSIASTADGKKLFVAGENLGQYLAGVYVSTDSGETWLPTSAPQLQWTSLAITPDGAKSAAVSHGGGVWISDPIVPVPPSVSTMPASAIKSFSAQLNGQVNPNLMPTTAWIQWGTSTAYGNSTLVTNLGSSNGVISISASIRGLLPNTLYHYRVVGLNNFGTNFGSNLTFTTVSNLFFNLAQPGDPVVPTPGSSPAGQEAPKAIDGTASSKYLIIDRYNTGLTIFPVATNIPMQALGLITAEDAPERDPSDFMVYGSQNGTDFTFIASNDFPHNLPRNSVQSFPFANTNTYAAYKVIFPYVNDVGRADSMQIAEVELLPYADITSSSDSLTLALPPGASLNGIGPEGSLLDRVLGGNANKLVVLNDTSDVVALITPAAGISVLKGFEFIGGNDDASFPGRTPSPLKIEGSNDGTNFIVIASVTLAPPATNMMIQGFSCFGNTNAYTKYRVTFGAPQSGNVLQVGELRLFGAVTPKMTVAKAGANWLFSWPVSGFTLQQSASLSPSNWTSAGNVLTITNGQTQVIISPTNGNKFYRLRFP